MELEKAIAALSALAQESRLGVFRLLVEVGPAGLPAGQIGEHFGLPSATLSFHLNQMKQADLVSCRRNGRSLIYAANFGTMTALMHYLSTNCCRGNVEDCTTPMSEQSDASSKGVTKP